MAIFGITLRYIWFVVPMAGFMLGQYMDEEESLRMTMYRDKSELYMCGHKEGTPPSWPTRIF